MAQPKVEMYATRFCGFCVRARMLLTEKGVDFEEIAVDLEPARRQEMMHRSGRRTVPQIFIDGRPVGGYMDLVNLDRAGELDGLLGLNE